MGTWNNRIVRYRKRSDGFGLHEVHYDDKGRPWGRAEGTSVFVGGSADEIRLQLALAIADAHRLPILNEPKRWPGTAPGQKPKRAILSAPQQGSER